MGILAKMKARASKNGKSNMIKKGSYIEQKGGDVGEFLSRQLQPNLKIIEKKKIKVITNAGGLSPLSLKEKIEGVVKKMNLNLKVAAVYGDDILGFGRSKSSFILNNFDEDKPNIDIGRDVKNPFKLLSANAYFGAKGIVKALEKGADIVITGRVVDSALVLGPLMYEYQWDQARKNQKISSQRYLDLLASASLAGHIIECGAQCCGGNYTKWKESYISGQDGWKNVGFPICTFHENGDFFISKSPNTGGCVTEASVAEQILYEIQDPSQYILPDVVVDMSNCKINEVYKNCVRVENVHGKPVEKNAFKVSITYQSNYKLQMMLLIAGEEAYMKSVAVADGLINKFSILLATLKLDPFIKTNVEVLGSEQGHGRFSRTRYTSREVMLSLSFVHASPKALSIISGEFAAAATAMAPGISGAGTGRPRPSPLIEYASCYVSRDAIKGFMSIGDDITEEFWDPIEEFHVTVPTRASVSQFVSLPTIPSYDPHVFVPIKLLAHGRSGDKGNHANIGLRVLNPSFYKLLCQSITSSFVLHTFHHFNPTSVRIYLLPGIHALNILVENALNGGGLASLLTDRQGKTHAQILLDQEILVPLSYVRPLLSSSLQVSSKF
eukprot:CAMPEP_0117419956 /NCGR_PEP_ID=MMETSP0758-20121206/1415_1 /TAXON_ID=63605 /ORGANISM="Percolomonas cosmopolitus, Strain AE-1 (ATCC 50343)" /LENGTH=610 /DNA_ID=CAMNT_0005201333 /DNA_START=74 /DNA_END=1906 /DNA_ORIENTATION=-